MPFRWFGRCGRSIFRLHCRFLYYEAKLICRKSAERRVDSPNVIGSRDLGFEKACFDAGCTTQSPQQAREPQNQFPLDCQIARHSRLQRLFQSLHSLRVFSAPTTVSAVRPCRSELQRERCLPFAVVGPVLLEALRRLASNLS